MNARIAAILVVLLAVLGGGALLTFQQERGQRASNVATLGRTLLKDLKAADIAAIRIANPAGTLTLERKAERWTIAERDGFPADYERVREFVLKAIELKVGQSEPIGEKDRARLELNPAGQEGAATRVEFLDAGGKPLATLLAGKKYFRTEPKDPARAIGDGRFVMLPGEPGTVFIVSDPLSQATVRSAEWIERDSFLVEKVKALEVRYPDGSGWKFERDGDTADWRLEGAAPGEKVEFTKANSASYSLNLLELADVAPPDAKPAELGLDHPTRIEATTLDGLAYSIRVGRLKDGNYPVTFSASGSLKRERAAEKDEKPEEAARRDKEHAERLAKMEARLPREKMLEKHVLLIPRAKLADTLVKREELLARPEEKK